MVLHVLLVFFGWLAHPFHISVCEIEVNASAHSLEISQRIFLDDLETALRKQPGWEKLDVTNPSDEKKFDSLLKDYITSRFSVLVNGRPVRLSYLGHEAESDAMWCYMEVTGVSTVNEIEVESQLLLDTFNDQMNLVHIKNNGEIRSLRLYEDNSRDSIRYN